MLEAMSLPIFTVDGGPGEDGNDSDTVSTGAIQGGDNPKQSAGVHAAAPGKKSKCQEAQPFVFNEGFPLVTTTIVAKIYHYEYVDMAELLIVNCGGLYITS